MKTKLTAVALIAVAAALCSGCSWLLSSSGTAPSIQDAYAALYSNGAYYAVKNGATVSSGTYCVLAEVYDPDRDVEAAVLTYSSSSASWSREPPYDSMSQTSETFLVDGPVTLSSGSHSWIFQFRDEDGNYSNLAQITLTIGG